MQPHHAADFTDRIIGTQGKGTRIKNNNGTYKIGEKYPKVRKVINAMRRQRRKVSFGVYKSVGIRNSACAVLTNAS